MTIYKHYSSPPTDYFKRNNGIDQITIKSENNQAYNLQQYLDGIITGKNVLQYNHIDSKFIYYPVLP